MLLWYLQHPSQSINSFSLKFSAMYSPRFLSGKKSICLFSMLFNISNALDDVTETSQCAFTVADEFI